MKKSLLVLVGLGAFASAAFAQSSVTLFGLVDLGIHHLRSGDLSALKGESLTRVSDGVVYGPGSRWGIRVKEDLGSDVTAAVLLESGFSADTGTLGQGGRAFGRQAFISVASATAGELRLGRQYVLHDETQAVTNPGGNTTVLNPGGAYTLPTGTFPLFIDAPRIDNTLHYLSPIFGGFRLQAMVGLGEGTQDRYQGVKASYAKGPLVVAASYEQSDALTPSPGGPSTVNKILEAGGNYDFGPFKLFGGFQQGKNLTNGVGTQIGTLTMPGLSGPANQLKAATLGTSMPLGAANLMVNYTRSRFGDASGQDVSIGRFGMGVTYAFSKQTSIYGAFAIASGDLKDDINEKQIVQFGLRKAF